MAPRPRRLARNAVGSAGPSDSGNAPKLHNFAVGGSKSAVAPAPTPSPKTAVVVGPPPAASKATSAQPSPPPKPALPAPQPAKSPDADIRTTDLVSAAPKQTTTTKAKKIHATTAAVPELGQQQQQPIEAPAAVTFGSAPPTTLTIIKPSTVVQGASPATTSILAAGVGLSSTTTRALGPAKQVPSLANPAGVNNNNNYYPSPSSSVIEAASPKGRPHVNGTPTSTILAISIVLVLVVLAIIVVVVRRRLKAEERLVLGAGGRGGNGGGGGVVRGWKTLDEDGGGQFADDLKTESGLSGEGSEMVMSDGASFVWSGQGYRGAEAEEREREEQERAYWAQHGHAQQAYEDTSRATAFDPPAPQRLYAAQMAPPPTRPPRPEDGSGRQPPFGLPAPPGSRNLYAPNAHQMSGRSERAAPPAGPAHNQPSYSTASSLHPSHAVTHHPPVRTRSKTTAGGSGPARKHAGPVGQREKSGAALDVQQGGQERASGSFSSLMMVGYDEEGSMVCPRSPLCLACKCRNPD